MKGLHVNAISETLADPACSFWLRDALLSALERDCVDALHDAQLLARLLAEHADEVTRAAMLRAAGL